MAIYKKIEDLPDAYTEMLVNAASKVMNATQILQNFAVVFFVSVTEPFAVSRGLFLGSLSNFGVLKCLCTPGEDMH